MLVIIFLFLRLRKGQSIIYINADGDKYAEKVNFK